MGFHVGQWERYQPIELYAMEDAWRWRRKQRLRALAIATAYIANHIPWHGDDVNHERLSEYLAALEEASLNEEVLGQEQEDGGE